MRTVVALPKGCSRPIQVAPLLKLAPGSIFVTTGSGGVSALPGGEKVVLLTKGGGPLELLTSKTSPPVTAPGIYLDASDLGKLGGAIEEPKLRPYRFGDTWRKIRSRAGVSLAVGALATLATAAVGLMLALTAATPAARVDAAKVRSVLSWARAPLDQLSTIPAPSLARLDAFRRKVDARIATADDCLTLLQGDQAAAATIPGITCAPARSSGWSAQTVEGVMTAVIGALTAILGFLGLATKYGFQQSPS